MTKQMTATAAYRNVAKVAEKIKNGEPATIPDMATGDVVRQGDLMLVCLGNVKLTGKPAASRQLAPGNSQGSRHIASGDVQVIDVDEAVVLKEINRLNPMTRGEQLFLGPVILARGPVTIEHPEHAWRTLPGESTYAVVIQRTYANEIRRAID